jgi:tetratricopeptide (TPR) repeat protein
LQRALTELGASKDQIKLYSSFANAQTGITASCPDILLTEFDLEGGACGLDLLVSQRKANHQSKKSLFMLVTGNTSQAAVARAAEEDVDGYIIKPYSLDGLRISLMKYAVEKMTPDGYSMLIDKGKEKFDAGQMDEAFKIFAEAKMHDPKPALACFYQGLIEESRKTPNHAESNYQAGLDHNRIHYKCLVALFDLLLSQNRNKEAYDVVRRIARYFPANPERMSAVLRLAVINEAYSDIEAYYQLFKRLDHRNETLVRHICAALIVCGRYYLKKKTNSRALELFDRAKTASPRNPRVLKEIISSLLQYNLLKEANQCLSAFPADFRGTPEYAALHYAVTEREAPADISIEFGLDLIARGNCDYLVYSTLIRRSFQAGRNEDAEELLAEALSSWPEKAEELRKLAKDARVEEEPAA